MPHRCTNCEHVFADGSKEMLSGCPDCGGNTFQYLPEDTGSPPEESPPDRAGTDSSVAETVGRAATTLRDAVTGSTGDDAPGEFDADPPAGDEPAEAGTTADSAAPVDPDATAGGNTAVDADATSDADAPSSESERSDPPEEEPTPDPFPPEADPRRDAELVDGSPGEPGDSGSEGPEDAGPEDFAQSSARTDVVSDEELPGGMAGFGRTPGDSPGDSAPAESRPESTGEPPTEGAQPPSTGTQPPTAGPDPPSDGRVVDTPSEDRPNLDELRQELNDQFEGIRIVERGQYELNLMELYEREETIIALKENGRYVIEPPESWRGES